MRIHAAFVREQIQHVRYSIVMSHEPIPHVVMSHEPIRVTYGRGIDMRVFQSLSLIDMSVFQSLSLAVA